MNRVPSVDLLIKLSFFVKIREGLEIVRLWILTLLIAHVLFCPQDYGDLLEGNPSGLDCLDGYYEDEADWSEPQGDGDSNSPDYPDESWD